MHSLIPTKTAVALVLLALVSAAARGQSAGPLDALPFVLSVADGELPPLVAKGADSLSKPAGMNDASYPGKADLGPKYGFLGCDERSFFLDPATQMMPISGTAPDIDGISVGLDWIATSGDGVLLNDPSPFFWAAILFSVTESTVGTTTNSGVINAQKVGGGGEAAGDFFGYYWPGSKLPPTVPLNVAVLPADSSEIDLHGGGPPSPVEADGVDVFLSLYQLIGSFPGFDLPDPTVYFTVSDATKALIPDPWVGGDQALKSGATIFKMEIVEVSPGAYMWMPPTVMFAPADIGLGRTEDVDALAYDEQQGFLLVSTDLTLAGVPSRDPILFVSLATDPPTPMPLRVDERATNRVSGRVDLGGAVSDDVNAICAIDPRGNTQRTQISDVFQVAFGSSSFPNAGGGSPNVSLSAFHTPGPAIHIVCRNLPQGVPRVLLLSALPTFVQLPSNALLLVPNLPLALWNPIGGDQQIQIAFPPNPLLTGLTIHYETFGLEPTGPFSTDIVGIGF